MSWARTARVRLGEVRNVGTTVPCPYSRATAMAPKRPVPIMALKPNAISDCWSAAVETNVLLPSMSVPNMTTAASMPAKSDQDREEPPRQLGGGEFANSHSHEPCPRHSGTACLSVSATSAFR